MRSWFPYMVQHAKRLFYTVTELRVELIALLNYSTYTAFMVIFQIGMYRAVCYQVAGEERDYMCLSLGREPSRNGTPEVFRRLEIEVQQASVKWSMAINLANMIPTVLVETFMGAWSDHNGRKTNVLLGVTGVTLFMFPSIIMLDSPKGSLYLVVIGHFVGGCLGHMTLSMVACFAYIVDTIPDKDKLTVRMAVFGFCTSASQIIGPMLSPPLLTVMSPSRAVTVCMSWAALTFFAALLLLEQRPPTEMRRLTIERKARLKAKLQLESTPIDNRVTTISSPANGQEMVNKPKIVAANDGHETPAAVKRSGSRPMQLLRQIKFLWLEIYHTYTRRRAGHRRCFLLCSTVVLFGHTMLEGTLRQLIFPLFVQKSPFFWGTSELARYRSLSGSLNLFGSFAGVILFKKLLRARDTTLVLLAMALQIVEMVLFGLAGSNGWLYTGAAVGCLTNMVGPCIKSFMAQLVDVDEIGKAFAAYGVINAFGGFVSSSFFSSVYMATVAWYAGFVFLVAGIIELGFFLMMIWVHIDFSQPRLLAKLCGKSKIDTQTVEVKP